MSKVTDYVASSFIRYPGGKTNLLEDIIPILLKNSLVSGEYREPFLGGGAVLLALLSANPQLKKVWINDRDPGMASLWTAVIQSPEDLIGRIQNFTPSIEDYIQFKHDLVRCTAMPADREQITDLGFKKLALHQTSFSGFGTKAGGPLGGFSQASQYKIGSRWSPVGLTEKIRAAHQLLSPVEIRENACTCLDFEEVMADTGSRASMYLDPPYFDKGSQLYQFGFCQADHERLAELLRKTTDPWLMSYDDCAAIRNLYDWASFQRLDVGYSSHVGEAGKKRSLTKSELLLFRREETLRSVADVSTRILNTNELPGQSLSGD